MISNNSDKSRWTLPGRLPMTILVLFCVVMTHLAVMADVNTEFFYTNSYPMNEEYWTQDAQFGNYHPETLTSKLEMGGSKWVLYAFMAYDNMLKAGPYNVATNPYLRTEDKISAPISGIMFNEPVGAADALESIKSIRLTVSPNKDLSGGKVYNPREPLNSIMTQVIFEIGDPKPNMYYSIDIELDAYKPNDRAAGWFNIKNLWINSPTSTVGMPDFSYSENSEANEYTVNLTAPDGWELHVMWGKYNSADDPLGDCFDESSTNGMELSGPMRETDIIKDPSPTWKNPVGSQFTKTFDTSEMTEYYVLRAKSRKVNDWRNQSNEIVKFISHEGVVTGIDSVAAAAAVREELWFNMQGVRVASPRSPGVYIHVRDGKARKIVL